MRAISYAGWHRADLISVVTPLHVSVADFPLWYDKLRPQIAQMADGSGERYRPEDITDALTTGRMTAWLALDASLIRCVMVTELVDYPRFRALRCVGLVGSQPLGWVKLLDWVEKQAVLMGCERIEALHPVGHERLFVTPGWSTFHVLSEKRL